MAILDDYADFAVSFLKTDTPDEVMHHARRAMIDWLGAVYSARESEPATSLVESCRDELGFGKSSVIGFGTTAVPATAAWLNGTLSHATEMDDSFRPAVFHPGCPIVAASLAVAEARNASTRELMKAMIVAYEISTRIGAAVQPAHVEYFHAAGTIGTIAAAAGAAAILCPDDAGRFRHALSISTTFAAGLQQALRSDANTKPLHVGNAAAAGLRAAQAAAHGVTGTADMLEGPVGFGAAMAASPDWSGATLGLGQVFNIARSTHKVHACCGHQFLPIDAVLLLKDKHGVDPEQIARIEIVTYRQALDATGRSNPATPYEAKFSMAYVVSHALLHGSVLLDAFSAERLQDRQIQQLMDRIVLREDAAMTAGFPVHRAATVAIVMQDGQRLEHRAAFRRGDPEWPLSDEELGQKFLLLSEPFLGGDRAGQLLDMLWRLEDVTLRGLDLGRLCGAASPGSQRPQVHAMP